MPEWLNGQVSKTLRGFASRGFESRSLRQVSLPNFVFCKAKCATKRDVALDQPNLFAGNAKELHKIFL